VKIDTYHDFFWNFGRGSVDSQGRPIQVNGVASPNGLGTHAPHSGEACVTYDLGGAYGHFAGGVGVDDSGPSSASPLTFRIVADGREVWRSKPIVTPQQAQTFDLDVAGTHQLELCVNCPGGNVGAHAVWTEPVVTRAAQIVRPYGSPYGAPKRAPLLSSVSPPATTQPGPATTDFDPARQKYQVFLYDLTPVSVDTLRDGFWGFGRGSVDSQGMPIRVNGLESPHGLGTHPPSNAAPPSSTTWAATSAIS